jgi:hypothetical protein
MDNNKLFDSACDLLTKKDLRILQLEQQLAAATEQVAQREQDFKGLLHKADSWERGMEWNAELCAEKDARIAELEDVHLVEDGDYPEDEARVEMTGENESFFGYYDNTDEKWVDEYGKFDKFIIIAWRYAEFSLLALAAQKRARRAAEAAAGGEANNG